MRILVVHEVNYLSKIIYEFQILPEILSMLGHEVTIVDYDDSWRNDPQGRGTTLRTRVYRHVHRAYPQASVTVRRPGMVRLPGLSRITGSFTASCEIRRAMKEEKPDVVLLYGIPTIGLQTIRIARRHRAPVLCRSIDVTHELVPNRLLVPATHVLAKYVFTHAAMDVALTPHLKKYIQSYGVPEGRIRLLPSGVDTKMFSPGRADVKTTRAWDIPAKSRVVLFMGTMYRFSGLDAVIRDWPKVAAEHPDAKLVIAGVGEDELRLRRLAVDSDVASDVIFTGLLPYSALPDLIRRSDVCINPFELNGVTEQILPTKLFQYLACAKPVVATRLPGALEFLRGEEHGVVYAELNNVGCEIAGLLSDPDRMIRLGRNGAAAVRRYDWVEIARTIASWMEELA